MVVFWPCPSLTASLDAFLAGHIETAAPAAIVSGILFLACFLMYRFVAHVDSSGARLAVASAFSLLSGRSRVTQQHVFEISQACLFPHYDQEIPR